MDEWMGPDDGAPLWREITKTKRGGKGRVPFGDSGKQRYESIGKTMTDPLAEDGSGSWEASWRLLQSSAA